MSHARPYLVRTGTARRSSAERRLRAGRLRAAAWRLGLRLRSDSGLASGRLTSRAAAARAARAARGVGARGCEGGEASEQPDGIDAGEHLTPALGASRAARCRAARLASRPRAPGDHRAPEEAW